MNKAIRGLLELARELINKDSPTWSEIGESSKILNFAAELMYAETHRIIASGGGHPTTL